MRDASGNIVGPTPSQVGREISSSAGPNLGTIREESLVGPQTSAPGRVPSSRDPTGIGMVPYDEPTAMIGIVPPGSNEMLANLARDGSNYPGSVAGATGPDDMLGREQSANVGKFPSTALMREPSSMDEANQMAPDGTPLGREGSIPGQIEAKGPEGSFISPCPSSSYQPGGPERESSALADDPTARDTMALAREGWGGGALPGISPSQLGREGMVTGDVLPPGIENLARDASLGPVAANLQYDQMPKGMDQVANMAGTQTQAPVIIFRPTIVIIQNNIAIPSDLLQKLLAQHQTQQQENPENTSTEPESLVTLQNQEVFIYPNRIETSSMSAAYTHNVSDPNAKPFLNYQEK